MNNKQKEKARNKAFVEYKKIYNIALAEYRKIEHPAYVEYEKKLKEIKASK